MGCLVGGSQTHAAMGESECERHEEERDRVD